MKNLNKKSGISLMVLAITVVIMIVIASTILVSYNNIIEDTLKKDFASEIYSIQKLVDQYYFINGRYPITSQYILDIDTIDEKFRFEFEEERVENNSIKLSIIDLKECDVENSKRGKKDTDNDIYVVSEKTGIIYYIKGAKFDDFVYYTLTDDLKREIGL
ncbi:MAG: hypothetical protein Q4D02_04860 [Clostridia bacterium]|nr:hypothetical protein [Clostridia bacterium]